MKAIVEHTPEEYKRLSELAEKTFSAIDGIRKSELFDNYKETRGYAHYKFSGNYTNLLVEKLGHRPTSEELIIIIDSGFSHFGASCHIVGNYFEGRVNVD